MNFKNKFLSLVSAVSLVFGAAAGNQLTCSAMSPSKTKVFFSGARATGKTAIIDRIKSGILRDRYWPTYQEYYIVDVGSNQKLEIWDMGGEDRYACIWPAFARNADILVFVLDLSEPNLERLQEIIDRVTPVSPNACRVLVLNKSDLSSDSINDEIRLFAAKNNLEGPFECSALRNDGIEEIKDFLTNKALELNNNRNSNLSSHLLPVQQAETDCCCEVA